MAGKGRHGLSPNRVILSLRPMARKAMVPAPGSPPHTLGQRSLLKKGGNMRFIVDLYRYLIFGILAVLIIGVVFGGLQLGASANIPQWVLGIYVAGGLAVAAVLIMLIGLTATIISIHDRHVELVEAIHAWREDTFK